MANTFLRQYSLQKPNNLSCRNTRSSLGHCQRLFRRPLHIYYKFFVKYFQMQNMLLLNLMFYLLEIVTGHHERQIDHLEAVAVIRGFKNINGVIMFTQSYSSNAPVALFGKVKNLPPGLHALHVHEFGNLTDNCESTGPHFNPDRVYHGGPDDIVRHVGDLGNIDGPLSANGFSITDNRLSLFGRNSIIGRSIAIHYKKDDFGRAGTMESLESGNAGLRIACGIIAWKNVVINS